MFYISASTPRIQARAQLEQMALATGKKVGGITQFPIKISTVFGVFPRKFHKAILHSYQPWCAVVLGVVTAVAGGILRDICINEVPLIFRKELYALAIKYSLGVPVLTGHGTTFHHDHKKHGPEK